MQASRVDSFCFFSGYTQGLFSLINFHEDDTDHIIHMRFMLPESQVFVASPYFQLNGVICELTYLDNHSFMLTTTQELAEKSSLWPLEQYKQFSLSPLLEWDTDDHQDYPLQPTPALQAILVKNPKKVGDNFKLTFDCARDEFLEKVLDEKQPYIGLMGSSVFLKKVKVGEERLRFTMFAWPATQKATQLNGDLKVGTEVDLNLPRLDFFRR